MVKVALFLLMAIISCSAQAASPVVSFSRAEKRSDQTVYHYSVTNDSPNPLVAVSVGENGCTDEEPELVQVPTGWDFDKGLPLSSSMAPTGWKARVMTQEESKRVLIEWRISEQRFKIPPGVSSSGFAIFVSTPDAHYTSAHWVAIDDRGLTYSGRMGMSGKLARWEGGHRSCP